MFDQDRACEEIANGKTLREVATALGLKSASSITNQARLDPVFDARYTRAMSLRAELDVEELRDIKQAVMDGSITPEQGRVAGDLIKWPAARRAAKLFGDKLQVDQDVRLQVELIDATAVTASIVHDVLPALAKPEEDPL